MNKPKPTRQMRFDEALERIADGFTVHRDDVMVRDHHRKVWVAEWHLPGCLSESFFVCRTKRQALETALLFADTGDNTYPRGMRTHLTHYGHFQHRTPLYGQVVTTIEATTLNSLLS